jgi:hypothetical protein
VIEMERLLVHSSNISSIGYVQSTQVLEIEFNSGSIYQYYNVPESIYNGLMAASSHGIFFQDHVRTVYKFKKIK